MLRHLIKLAVGIRDVDHLAAVQGTRAAERGGRTVTFAYTRRRPREPEAVTAGGSLYWVIKGAIRCRQRVLDLDAAVDGDGEPYCLIVLDPALVPTSPVPRSAFQGWRYLDPANAPPDLADAGAGVAEMPPELIAELRGLGLL